MPDLDGPVLRSRRIGHRYADPVDASRLPTPLYAADLPLLLEMVNRLVELQRLWVDRVEELLALGLPDWRAQGWVPRSPTSYSGRATKISANDRAMLADFVRRLFNRLDDVDTCWSTATFIQAMSAAMPGNDIAGLAGRRPAGGHLWKRSRQHRAFRAGHHRADPAKWLNRTAAHVRAGMKSGLSDSGGARLGRGLSHAPSRASLIVRVMTAPVGGQLADIVPPS